jgi:preprotein translocase subunit SecB
MTDIATGPGAPADGNGAGQPGLRVLAQYIRDLSFENPRAPESLRGAETQPQIDLGVELNARGRDDGLFESELKLTARAVRAADTVFHVELVYAGLFQLVGVTGQDLELALMIECPRYLFPFARRIISDLSAEGGFPPLMLEPIDFAHLYRVRRAQAAEDAPGLA